MSDTVQTIPEGDWLSPAEAAIRLKLSETAVRQRAHRGKLMSRTAPNGKLEVLTPRDPMQPDTTALVPASQQIVTIARQAEEVGKLKEKLAQTQADLRAADREIRRLRRRIDELEAAQEALGRPQNGQTNAEVGET
jgi:chromosome segregation ATPase